MKIPQIAVIGSAGAEEYPMDKPLPEMFAAARELGRRLGEQKYIVVTGGKGGVMEAVSAGTKEGGGFTVAEIRGLDRGTSNAFIDVEILTGDVAFRGPSQLVGMSDVVIALGGGAGTLQEICVAYRLRKPIILLTGYGGWVDRLANAPYLDERQLVPFTMVRSPQEAMEKLRSLLE